MKLRDFVSENGSYIIPVKWEVYSTVCITGVNNLEEAVQVAKQYVDDLPLGDSEYIDDSYEIDIHDDEDALNAQEYVHFGGVYFNNPRND